MNSRPVQPHISLPVAFIITLAMAVSYTAIDILQFAEPLQSLLSFAPAAISLAVLSTAGLSRAELNLRIAPASCPGVLSLIGITALLLPILGSSTAWIGWQWLPALVYAPASGIAQELYFRSSLLPGLERVFGGRKTLALLVHSAVFVGFHFRTFQTIPSLSPKLVVTFVLFMGGFGWGWQVQRDHTVTWAMLQHSLFLVLMSMFEWS